MHFCWCHLLIVADGVVGIQMMEPGINRDRIELTGNILISGYHIKTRCDHELWNLKGWDMMHEFESELPLNSSNSLLSSSTSPDSCWLPKKGNFIWILVLHYLDPSAALIRRSHVEQEDTDHDTSSSMSELDTVAARLFPSLGDLDHNHALMTPPNGNLCGCKTAAPMQHHPRIPTSASWRRPGLLV